ncbi:hypothetical protein [Mycobacteroides chelonae]|nr:hypothetical protein [Mycobacteroides chelonae]
MSSGENSVGALMAADAFLAVEVLGRRVWCGPLVGPHHTPD